jgi:hypothetical protein
MIVLAACCSVPLSYAGAGSCAASTEAVPLCKILSDATANNGKEVVVRGLYRIVIHGSVLWSPECSEHLVNVRTANEYKANKGASTAIRNAVKKNESADVVLRGTFRVAHQEQCFGQNCLTYEIEVNELRCAEPWNEPAKSANVGESH